jgi:hypothetical protein
MSTTQAFRNALHVPFTDPNVGEVVTTLSAGDTYVTDWAPGAAGAGFPNPSKQNQMLVSGAFPNYLWELIDTIDAGTF